MYTYITYQLCPIKLFVLSYLRPVLWKDPYELIWRRFEASAENCWANAFCSVCNLGQKPKHHDVYVKCGIFLLYLCVGISGFQVPISSHSLGSSTISTFKTNTELKLGCTVNTWMGWNPVLKEPDIYMGIMPDASTVDTVIHSWSIHMLRQRWHLPLRMSFSQWNGHYCVISVDAETCKQPKTPSLFEESWI